MEPPSSHSQILGRSTAIRRLLEQIERAVPHLRVGAIEGEAGTGKSMVARSLHECGPASHGPLLAMHSSVFDPSKIPASGGLVWLQRVDEMPANRQAMLLHFLRCRESFTLEPTPIPLQVVVSSTRSLRALVAAGSLMPDLAYRLTAVRFYLPPLRERHEDIPVLAQAFLDSFARKYRKPIQGLGTGTLARLFSHTWPGNVRELHSVLEAAALEVDGQWIRPIDIVLTPPVSIKLAQEAVTQSLTRKDWTLEAATRDHIATVMAFTGGNKKRAAGLLGISRSTLYRLLEQS
ncbi:MAG TPA: sigma 54-interacting transcriptional regulator [Acidisarcina sp.]|nr:sigma 54-interacting transcriptional regulator [Acidisarcina sp.]